MCALVCDSYRVQRIYFLYFSALHSLMHPPRILTDQYENIYVTSFLNEK